MSDEHYRLVHPDGRVESAEGRLPKVGTDLGGFRVDFISQGDEPTVYLGLHYLQTALVKLVYIVAGGERCPITLAEAAALAERLRQKSAGELAAPATAVAVRFEQLLEESPAESLEMSFFESEKAVLQEVVEEWVFGISIENVPMRVRTVRDALAREAAGE
jgi:hypothetical protein